ncbi:MAG: signal peptidase II [Phenylobacterium sp.]|uniref:signal peptidase II n=1 Tax=Phenylobacterium sp. TaxID=1871053 RepID=UPI0027260D65|nr:signal peptidase II [Phenylobacterium sp.]MDO9431888.1 signal peptidase II [Phenylobacterium sp.]
MKAVTKLGWTAYALALFVIIADQLSKHWILFVYDLPARFSVPIAGPFSLTMVWNRGVSFGLFRADADLVRWLLSAFSIIVAIVLAVWARKTERPFMAIGLGLVIGGAIGNVIDRIRFGAVADFLDFQRLGFFPWVFNVADSAITIGVVFLLLDSMRKESAS